MSIISKIKMLLFKPRNIDNTKYELLLWNIDITKYELLLFCVNCCKDFKVSIPIGIDANEANLPYGIYLSKDGGYYNTYGVATTTANYIICPHCGSRKVKKE